MKQIKSKISTVDEAMSIIVDGSRVMVGGFGLKGTPNYLIDALVNSGAKDLTIISNDLGSPGEGLGKLLRNGQVKALIGNYYNWNPEVADAYNAGEIDVTLIPQGTFAESLRAGANGIPAYFCPVGAGTELAKGKESRNINGVECVLEYALTSDLALVEAHIADELGNLTYQRVARNFNPAMASAATHTIVQVDEVVPVGQLDPEQIVTPHIDVTRIVVKEA